MNEQASVSTHTDYKIFFLILAITFSIFLVTASGHSFSPDESESLNQAKRLLSQTHDPNFIQGVTRPGLQETGFINWSWPTCKDDILCSGVPIGHAVSMVPFVFLEENMHIIPPHIFTNEDFHDDHYVWWRNNRTSEETFTFLFYGPIITALSVATLFLVCRTYDFDLKTSVIVSFLYGFTTIAWEYSSTGLNVVPSTLMILLAFFCFRKFQQRNSVISLIFCGLSLGFSFLVRYDTIIFVVILFIFIIYNIMKKKQKIKNIASVTGPLFFCGLIFLGINFIRFGSFLEFGYGGEDRVSLDFSASPHVGIFGLLFSPGAGLFIFSPILLTMFISFSDFYGKDKGYVFISLALFTSLLFFFGSLDNWHGFVSWGTRYMIPIIPFLMLPLAATIKKRKNKLFYVSLLIFGIIGVFFNIISLIQDVSWFVWGLSGGNSGLFSLGIAGMHPLNLNPLVLWTFEYSQLTQAIILAFTNLQIDLFLFKVLGPTVFGLTFITITITLIYLLLRTCKKSKTSLKKLRF